MNLLPSRELTCRLFSKLVGSLFELVEVIEIVFLFLAFLPLDQLTRTCAVSSVLTRLLMAFLMHVSLLHLLLLFLLLRPRLRSLGDCFLGVLMPVCVRISVQIQRLTHKVILCRGA